MRKTQITEEDINQIKNKNFPVEHWELQLGIGYVYENAPMGVRYSVPYLEYGKKLWVAVKYDLYSLICKPGDSSPREWVSDLVSGDIRNTIVGIASVITSKYEVSMGIAIPIVALIIKTGVLNYCEDVPEKPDESSKKIFKKMLSWNEEKVTKKKIKKKKLEEERKG